MRNERICLAIVACCIEGASRMRQSGFVSMDKLPYGSFVHYISLVKV